MVRVSISVAVQNGGHTRSGGCIRGGRYDNRDGCSLIRMGVHIVVGIVLTMDALMTVGMVAHVC